MTRELWRLLVEVGGPEPPALTSIECFALLEYFAEVADQPLSQGDRSLAQTRCMACVPVCRAELFAILDQIATAHRTTRQEMIEEEGG